MADPKPSPSKGRPVATQGAARKPAAGGPSSGGAAGGNDVGDADKTFVPDNLQATHIADDGKTVVPDSPPPEKGTPSPKGAAAEPQKPAKSAEKTGQRFGKYEIVKKLGQGGMGAVYLAKDVNLDRSVALKTMTKELAAKPDFVARFKREARAMARFTHPNIVQIFDVDEVNGQHYASIEFIDGQSMQKWMDQKKRLSLADAVHVTLVCCEALRAAHNENMIHRDIKPDNILVTSKGVIKVADFGLAKATDEDVSMTQSGTGLGTPLYMAPEQARNAKHVDKRTDIYAVGCMLYYFVTGKLPFAGSNTLELIMAKEQGRYQAPRKINAEIPDRLDLIIGKMIEKDAKNRYADCAEVIRDLSSLELAGDSLSFITAADKAVLGRMSSSTPSSVSAPPKASGVVPRSSADDAAKQESAAAASDQQVYYIQFTDKAGKTQVKKMTPGQILHSVQGGIIDHKAKAKKTADGQFIPLSQFPEFARVVEKKANAARAESKAGSLAAEFAKLDKQYQRRGLMRWLRNMATNVKGVTILAIYLGLIGVGLWAAWKYGVPWVQGMMNK